MKRRRHMARPRLARLLVRALLMPACSLAYSSGGGRERGVQSCDAIDICKYGCPPGMTKVAPPERSDTYTLRTGDGPVVGSDPTHYVPGELLPLYMRVVKRTIVGKGWCTIPIKFGGVRETNERCFTGNESAKYIGLLLYAVRTGDTSEHKLGEWAIPLQEPTKWWAPPDMPGCDRRALMHRYAEPKHFLERVVFRAPPAGTGSITFRALLKQGDTNQGAFYWPSVPSSGLSATLDPSPGRSGGDLVLDELVPAPSAARTWSFRGAPGEPCTAVCAAQGLACDAEQLLAATSAEALLARVEPDFLCAPPYLRTCSDAAPHMSGLGDGLCFYRDDNGTCPARAEVNSACDALPSNSLEDGLRLCPCVDLPGRRLAGANETDDVAADVSNGAAAAAYANVAEHDGGPPEQRAEHAVAPCEPPATHRPHDGHGAGGDPLRCPNQRAVHRALAVETAEAAEAAGAAEAPVTGSAARFAPKAPHAQQWPSSSGPLEQIGALCALVMGLALMAAWRRAGGGWRRGGGQHGGAAVALGLLAAEGASAHNWLRSISSRARNVASTMAPCRVRTQFAYPSIQVSTQRLFDPAYMLHARRHRTWLPFGQVNANTTFVMEWATGHGGYTDIVFIHAKDYLMLQKASDRLLSKYIYEAPPEAHELFRGPQWARNHLGNVNPSSVRDTCDESLYSWQCTAFEINQSHPQFVHRPWGRHSSQLGYHEGERAGDVRIAYSHPEMPWLLALHRFKITWHYPKNADTAHFRFPPGTPAGQYIVHYKWGGYLDCVDVDVLPDHKPVPQTKEGIYGYRPDEPDSYLKNDHCQYAAGQYDIASDEAASCAGGVAPPDGSATCFAIPPAGQLNNKGQTTEEALAACQARCSGARTVFRPRVAYNPLRLEGGEPMGGRCEALNVVPLTPPPQVAFPEDQNIPWGLGDCTRECFAGEPQGTSICYGLRETSRRTVEAPWDIIQDDPRDEVSILTPS